MGKGMEKGWGLGWSWVFSVPGTWAARGCALSPASGRCRCGSIRTQKTKGAVETWVRGTRADDIQQPQRVSPSLTPLSGLTLFLTATFGTSAPDNRDRTLLDKQASSAAPSRQRHSVPLVGLKG
ncbi:unnamed protein product [Rangifer tarandus platyrhynchus]|uniref:Secreted protein n=1 Tax=Rangifer tarandus platyrhynchus TaxID=3082113 RepID=A0ABN9A1U0_RANTA|nr:unnamed protein product [Rangifer tarandus platyrhynchus]